MTALRTSAAAAGTGRLVALLGLGVAWPFVLPDYTHFYGVLIVVYSMVALSLTVLAGWTGQISVGQAAFLGLGVYTSQPLLARGWPLPLVVIVVAVVGALTSLVLGIPSLRLRGVYLAIVTLAFQTMCELFVFPLDAVSGGSAAKPVPRASFFGLSTATDRGLYLVALMVLVGALVVVNNLRRSDIGRVLFAIRDSEDGAQAMGVRLAPYKIGAFAIAAVLASVPGVFYGMLFNATPAGNQFGVLLSLFFLALPVIGGLTSSTGAVAGGIVFALAQPVVNAFGVRLYLTSGALLILVLLVRTGGIVGAITMARRSVETHLGAQRLRPPQRVDGATLAGDVPRVRVRVVGEDVFGSRIRLTVRSGSRS